MTYHLMRETYPKAAKPHRCIWCGETIPKGEQYRHESSIYDGRWQDHKWHMECDEDSREYFAGGEEEFTAYSADRPKP